MNKIMIYALILSISSGCNRGEVVKGLPLFKKSTKEVGLRSTNLSFTGVEIDTSLVNEIVSKAPASVSISVPSGNDILVLVMEKQDVFDPVFEVVSDTGKVDYKSNSVFYTGSVEGDEGSVVSVNIINGEVTGFISSKKYGELIIGKESEISTTSYLIYDPLSTQDTFKFNCQELNIGASLKKDLDIKIQQTSASRCVTIDFELTNEIFAYFGSVQKSNDWFLAQFASVKALYKADGVDIAISKIYNWTTPDGYPTDAASALGEVTKRRANDASFSGDLLQLVRGRSSSGYSGIAYVDVLCLNSHRFSYAEVMWTYSVYPAYSWNIEVISHELGHNMGCPHTHNCNWELSPGIFGAIDACYTTEGGCSAPIPCSGCGTVMSYCHMKQGVGINLRNGFGPIPKKRLEDRINNRPCTTCGAVIDPPVTNGGGIISKGKPVNQSSIFSTYPPTNVNDGNEGSYNHTKQEEYPWVEIDLGDVYKVTKIRLLARKDCCRYRMRNARVFLSNNPVSAYDTPGYIWEASVGTGIVELVNENITGSGRFLRVYNKNLSVGDYSHWAEIEVWGSKGNVVCVNDTIKVPYTAYRDSIIRVCK